MTPLRAHVLGAGISGSAATEWLLKHGWMVIVSDDGIGSDLELAAAKLRGLGAEIILGGHQGALSKPAQLVVVSPGMPTTSQVIIERRRQGAEVIGELELGARQTKGTIAAVTGANGKSTTTALIGEIFAHTGQPSFTVGNIGTPLISIADRTTPDSLVALEVSSYQLETIATFKPHVGALLNLTPDHLERHGSFEKYGAAKARLWMNQTSDDWLVFNADDPAVVSLVKSAKSATIPFSLTGKLELGGWLEGESFVVKLQGQPELRIPKKSSLLTGKHNEANILAAMLSSMLAGATAEAVKKGISSFRGLPHRLEKVRVFDGVAWVNDSKATNCDAGRWALEATPAPIILIAGGKPKGGGFKSIRPYLKDRVKQLILLGVAADEIRKDLGDMAPVEMVKDITEAVQIARKLARQGDTVLLSPLCASFDQFRNFEERGDRFRELVMNLK